MVRVIAIEPYNNLQPGDVEEVSDRIAEQLERKGLATRALPPQYEVVDRPTQAAGEGVSAYASQAVQVLQGATAKPSKRGGKQKKTAG